MGMEHPVLPGVRVADTWVEEYALPPGYSFRLSRDYIWLVWGAEDILFEVPASYVAEWGMRKFRSFVSQELKRHAVVQGAAAAILKEVYARGEQAGNASS
jgi:hypothetical protein